MEVRDLGSNLGLYTKFLDNFGHLNSLWEFLPSMSVMVRIPIFYECGIVQLWKYAEYGVEMPSCI